MQNVFMAGETIFLRAVEPEDAPILAACNNHPEVRVSFFTHTPTSVAVQRKRIETFYQPGADYIPFVVCAKDTGEGLSLIHI